MSGSADEFASGDIWSGGTGDVGVAVDDSEELGEADGVAREIHDVIVTAVWKNERGVEVASISPNNRSSARGLKGVVVFSGHGRGSESGVEGGEPKLSPTKS